jgi:hypothetical protein
VGQSCGTTKLGCGLFTKGCNRPQKGTLRAGVGAVSLFASAESDDSPIRESLAKLAKNAHVQIHPID